MFSWYLYWYWWTYTRVAILNHTNFISSFVRSFLFYSVLRLARLRTFFPFSFFFFLFLRHRFHVQCTRTKSIFLHHYLMIYTEACKTPSKLVHLPISILNSTKWNSAFDGIAILVLFEIHAHMCVAAHRWMKSIELLYCWNLSKCVYGVATAADGGAESVCVLFYRISMHWCVLMWLNGRKKAHTSSKANAQPTCCHCRLLH